MKVFDNKHIKNIVLLGSQKSGKTTLAETMLFEAGLINRRGSVENHNTVSDYHALEHEREGSVYTTLLHTEWRNYKINILDTPGLDDFVGEVISSVRVADTCVYLINAQYGVEVGTELIWNHVDELQKPTIFVINQLDHPKSNYDFALESLKEHYGSAVTPMQFPVNEGPGFNGIIDLLKMRYYKFGESGGKPEKLEIPELFREKAEKMHNELVEKAAENDEGLMELYFEKGTLSEDEMRKGLRLGMLNHDVFPVFCISAKNDMGSGRLMGFIDNVAPSAIDAMPEHDASGNVIPLKEDAPTELFVFKTRIEQNLGQLTFFKVVSGTLKEGMELVNQQNGQTERINQLFIIDGHNRNQVDTLGTGDIGATLKLKNTATNDTLGSEDLKSPVAPMEFPAPRLTVAITAANRSDEEKMTEVLHRLVAEDPTIDVHYSNELRQMLVGCQGELHLSVIKWILENMYDLNIDFETPRVSYRESITIPAESVYRHKKQSGGAGQFAEVHMKIMPYTEGMDDPQGFNIRDKQVIDLEWGGKLVYYNCIVGGAIDNRFHPSILKGIMEVLANGPVTGSYVRDVCVMVHDGKMHPVDSNDIAFKIAGTYAFKEAFMNAKPVVMEPINELEVYVPEELMGDVMTDLQTRRSIITGVDMKGNYQVIKAKTPVAELDKYTTALRSITQGRSSFKTKFAEYAPVSSENIAAMAVH
ncbi:elongation factor G [Fulvivirga sedimenti]|uniref:Elongation factor G n=1 Tax=Fulvivirga sedimenti TaxID=2879465 RepID=A0A9X1KYU4_9BACT|nr:elongation factor G [Fulvivirga sedimenti]MCA6073981.1 elongation factor G [Fulvivirga sedimenti]